MLDELTAVHKIIGIVSLVVGLGAYPFKFLWGKIKEHDVTLKEHRDMLGNRYTKEETKEVISWSLEPLARTAEHLEETSRHLLEVVRKLEIEQAKLERRNLDSCDS